LVAARFRDFAGGFLAAPPPTLRRQRHVKLNSHFILGSDARFSGKLDPKFGLFHGGLARCNTVQFSFTTILPLALSGSGSEGGNAIRAYLGRPIAVANGRSGDRSEALVFKNPATFVTLSSEPVLVPYSGTCRTFSVCSQHIRHLSADVWAYLSGRRECVERNRKALAGYWEDCGQI
jgi:hypothetical protein